jgi:predicted nucleic acid-binding protein
VILLDTNVLSELIRPAATERVLVWAHSLAPNSMATTSINEGELWFGALALPEGQRRRALLRAIGTMLGTVLNGRVFPFDRAAAHIYGQLAADRRRAGRTTGAADLQIAAIARALSVTAIATRNVGHFIDCGIPVVNPWTVS